MFKPMLAASVDTLASVKFPVIASPKLDGVRAVVIDGVAMSRSLKPIPNLHVQKLFGHPELNGLDGELIIGRATDPECYRETVSGVMTRDGQPRVFFHVFDDATDPTLPFIGRLHQVNQRAGASRPSDWGLLRHQTISTTDELLSFEGECLQRGYEGVMLRNPHGRYKHGRSTLKEGLLLKLKEFADSDAEIIGFTELMHNANEAKTNELGHTQRSSHKTNMVPTGTLGSFVVRDLHTGVKFEIGTGMDAALRKQVWENRTHYFKMIIKYKHFPTGGYEKPRFPTFLGFRDKLDMS